MTFPFPIPKLWKHRLILIFAAFVFGMLLVAIGAASVTAKHASAGPVPRATVTVTEHATVTRTAKPALPEACQRFVDDAVKLYTDFATFEANYGDWRNDMSIAASALEANRADLLNGARATLQRLDLDSNSNLNDIITLYQTTDQANTQCKGDLK